VNGFDVLDVDVAGLSWLDEVWDRLPPTRAHATRSGGRHLFFRHVDGLRNSVSRIADNVDVRADGGFVIWWPRQGLRVLSDAEIAEWPDWLLELARGVNPSVPLEGLVDGGMGERRHGTDGFKAYNGKWMGERTLNPLARCKALQRKVEQAQHGKRNLLLHWASYRFGWMIAENVISADVAALLLESSAKINGIWGDDGAAQCRATIKSGISAGIRDARDLRVSDNVVEFKRMKE
jgi:hypothetical protein